MTASRPLGAVAATVRIIVGVAVAVCCVAGAVAAVAAPWPVFSAEPARVEVTPVPGDTTLVCNGDLRAIGRDRSNALQMSSAGSPSLTVAGEPESETLAVLDMQGAGEPRRLTGTVESRLSSLIAATESVDVAASDLFGFAAAPCREALTESWLVGGSIQTGAEDLIVLTNPGDVPSTVTLTVFGTVPGASTTIVQAGSQLAVPLSSIAVGAAAPVVKVAATGAPIRASLQSSLTRTLDPVGIDWQDATAGPQRYPVFPGVRVFESDGDGADMTFLRLMSPERDTEATVTVTAVGGSTPVSESSVELSADEAVQVPLSTLKDGTYTIRVDAKAPVLAAVRVQDGAGPGSDFAWALPSPELTGDIVVAVPAGPAGRLLLSNEGYEDATATVRADGGRGEARVVKIPARSAVVVDVENQATYRVSATGSLRAAVSMTGAGALANWPVWPANGAERSITVYP